MFGRILTVNKARPFAGKTEDGLGNNGPEATGLSKPDDGDDRMQKKTENVAHAADGSKLKKLKNSVRLWNSPPTRSESRAARAGAPGAHS